MDKVTRIDLNALGAAMEHRAHDKESHDLYQEQVAAEKQCINKMISRME
ncbi:hypothetical protein [Klebsiella variicola]|nr:hypothetical protein [Klebsiella variicola]